MPLTRLRLRDVVRQMRLRATAALLVTPAILSCGDSAALVAGEQDTVAVFRWIGDQSGSGSLFVQGSAVFTP